jgi:hypothetical protein
MKEDERSKDQLNESDGEGKRLETNHEALNRDELGTVTRG